MVKKKLLFLHEETTSRSSSAKGSQDQQSTFCIETDGFLSKRHTLGKRETKRICPCCPFLNLLNDCDIQTESFFVTRGNQYLREKKNFQRSRSGRQLFTLLISTPQTSVFATTSVFKPRKASSSQRALRSCFIKSF